MMKNKNIKLVSIALVVIMLVSFGYTGLIKAAPINNEVKTEIVNLDGTPRWTSRISDKYGITHEEVLELYKNGMSAEQAEEYIRANYPIESRPLTTEDYVELSGKLDISRIDAVEAYILAYKYRKDPEWIVSLYKDTGDWDRVKNAFVRRNDITSKISKLILNKDEDFTIEKITDLFVDIYKVDPKEIETFLELNNIHNAYLLSDFMFFFDIYSENELNINIYGFGQEYFKESKILQRNILGVTDITLLKMNEIQDIQPIQLDSKYDEDYLIEQLGFLNENWINKSPAEVEQGMIYAPLAAPNSTAPNVSAFSGTLNDSGYSSPFNVSYGNAQESISPSTGSLTITETDFVLPGKYGMDFSFTRVFNSNKTNFQRPDYTIVEYTADYTGEYLYVVAGGYGGIDFYDFNSISVPYNEQIFTTGSGIITPMALTPDPDRPVEIEVYWDFSYDGQDPYYGGDVYGTYTETEYTTTHYLNGPSTTNMTGYSSSGGWGPPLPSDIHVGTYTYQGPAYDVNPILISETSSDPFDFGKGWTLKFPSVEIVSNNEKYVHFGDGSAYKVENTGYLKNLDSQSMKLVNNTAYEYLDTVSSMALECLDGIIYYFDSSGKLLAIEDKYESLIRFIYNDGKIDKIIDSVGRVIDFDHTNTLTTVTIYESEFSMTPLSIWEYEKENTGINNEYKLLKVNPPTGNSINYGYYIANGRFGSKYGQSRTMNTLQLVSVTNAAGATSYFEYITYLKNLENISPSAGSGTENMTCYRISRRYTIVPTIEVIETDKISKENTENDVRFAYQGWNNTTKKYYSTKTISSESGIAPAVEKFEFDSEHRTVLQ